MTSNTVLETTQEESTDNPFLVLVYRSAFVQFFYSSSSSTDDTDDVMSGDTNSVQNEQGEN